jgi:methanogenic corrinoid protein MtbC1
MGTAEEIYAKMQASIRDYDRDAAVTAAQEALEAGLDPLVAVEKGFAEPIRELGDAFDRMEIFLPQLVMAAGSALEKKGTVVLGTVEGDIHDIGKTVVGAMMQANGYEVHDLGVEVPSTRFIQAAEELGADIIAMSALLSTTMLFQRDVVELLQNKGIREKYYVIVGGAPVTQSWADEIGADGFARDAVEAVKVLDSR